MEYHISKYSLNTLFSFTFSIALASTVLLPGYTQQFNSGSFSNNIPNQAIQTNNAVNNIVNTVLPSGINNVSTITNQSVSAISGNLSSVNLGQIGNTSGIINIGSLTSVIPFENFTNTPIFTNELTNQTSIFNLLTDNIEINQAAIGPIKIQEGIQVYSNNISKPSVAKFVNIGEVKEATSLDIEQGDSGTSVSQVSERITQGTPQGDSGTSVSQVSERITQGYSSG